MSKNFEQTGFLFGSNAVFIEELYKLYLNDPSSVDESWRSFFAGMTIDNVQAQSNAVIVGHSSAKVIVEEQHEGRHPKLEGRHPELVSGSQERLKQVQDDGFLPIQHDGIARLIISAWRRYGHYLANLDPLGIEKPKSKEELGLDFKSFGLSTSELDSTINLPNFGNIKLGGLIEELERKYSGTLAVEFYHIDNRLEQDWLYNEFDNIAKPADPERRKALKYMLEAETFEQYVHTKFPGAKRFSIEGGESAIAVFMQAINMLAEAGSSEIEIGMAHRGRLSTLTGIIGKPYRAVFSEFMGMSTIPKGLDISGDVKYHMGYSSRQTTDSGKDYGISMICNPSHLEAVNPVMAGNLRAKQDFLKDKERKLVAGILVHGDTAFCGQGIVAESLVLSGLAAYNTGGIIHLVINNQIGFTADIGDARTGRYATDIAKAIAAPIIHVNGDDPDAVLAATGIAVKYKQKFAKDIVLDVICYRKYGHNEGDEPMYTQGVMYNIIKAKKTPASIYADTLVAQGVMDSGHFESLKKEMKVRLDKEYESSKTYEPVSLRGSEELVSGAHEMLNQVQHDIKSNATTGVDKAYLTELGLKLCDIPEKADINDKLLKLFKQRAEILKQDKPIDWATAEQLAFAGLLCEGIPIRITGQDCERGTFSHRHAVLHSQIDNSKYVPLNHLAENQAGFEIANSNLSEFGVLGFEYGYSLVNPRHLVIWEAQFGDFANGGQTIFDQFISAAEAKWMQQSHLTVLLPHAFEGQGPEHSSARLERFLQLAAEDNIRVTYPTTPASIFHLLRRQIYANERKPLIVMTPKSLLRHKLAVSPMADLDKGTVFQPVLGEINENISASDTKKVIFCSGKVYYDLLEAREAGGIRDTVIIRFEQLYPFPEESVTAEILKYNQASRFIWCQEEPKNMGAWSFIKNYLNDCLQKADIKNSMEYIGRKESASPAVGNHHKHEEQQAALVKAALTVIASH